MKRTFVSLVCFLFINVLMAQKVSYNLPKDVANEKCSFIFQKVSASTTSYYINYKAQNLGDGILIINRNKASLKQNEGELHPTKERYVLKSNESKTIYNQFRVKPPVNANADIFDLELKGIQYASKKAEVLEAKSFVLGEKATLAVGNFSIKVMEYNVYEDRIFAEIKCLYNGGISQLGKIDLTKLNVAGGDAKIVKKGDVVFNGKSYSFAMNVTPQGKELTLDWGGVFQELKLVDIKLEKVIITSTNYKDPEVDKNKKVEEKVSKEAIMKKVENCELSYTDFTALKKDVETEMNNGGKPVEMANEFLMEKGCINTAQVLEILEVFNLDGSKLKFAKMAYAFTSDKLIYHKVVAKLAYIKNKQALEEFLEQQ